jgi:hypothetical protein
MHPEGDLPDTASVAGRRAALARERAERELAAAARQERLAERTGLAIHVRLAGLHRQSAACQLTAARLQEMHARLLARWEQGRGAPPRFMTGVAELCGTRSAAIALVGADHGQLAVAASDKAAQAAQELEFVLGEGPARDATVRRCVVSASGPQVRERWPGYGAAVGELGIDEVVAVPLGLGAKCVGSLTVFDPRPGFADVFTEVAEALTRTVILGPHPDPGLYGETDHRAVVHQAAGMVSVQAGCSLGDALELVKAHAFSEGEPVRNVAQRIVRGELRFD